MKKIKLLTDSASDITDEELKRLNIDMLSIPITIDGIGFYERESFSFEEYYHLLSQAGEVPTTSRIPQQSYMDYFEKNYVLGYEDLIVVTISSTGSGTFDSACLAKKQFYHTHPQAGETFQIHILDSKTYSLGYGWPIIQAAQMAQDDFLVDSILEYLRHWFQRVEIFLGCYTLEYAKKSGRINAATAFLGEMLGMRPIILMKDGGTGNIAKVRGDGKVTLGIMSEYKKRYTKEDTVIIVCGENQSHALELQNHLKKERKEVVPIYQAGACIVTNAGPHMIALVCHTSPVEKKDRTGEK